MEEQLEVVIAVTNTEEPTRGVVVASQSVVAESLA